MSFLLGLAEGFHAAQTAKSAQEMEAAQKAADREAAIYQTLLSSDRPDVQQLALTGLFESAQPRKRKGGLRGWLGEMESSAIYPQMQALVAGSTVEDRQTLPSTRMVPPASDQIQPAVISQTPGAAPAAMPETNAVTPGQQGPPPPLTYTQSGPQDYQTMAPPKPVFLTPEAKLIAAAKAHALESELTVAGDSRAVYNAIRQNGGSHEEGQHAVRVKLGIDPKATTTQAKDQFLGNVLGENINAEEWQGSGNTEPADPKQMYRRMKGGDGAVHFFAVDTSTSSGAKITTLNDPQTGRNVRVMVNADGTATVIGEAPSTYRFLQRVFPDGTVEYVPVVPNVKAVIPIRASDPKAGAAGGPPPAPGQQTVAAPGQAPVAGGQAQAGPPAPRSAAPAASPASRTATPPPAPARGGSSARPTSPGAISGGQRPVNWPVTPAAVLGPNGEIQVIQAERNPRTQEIHDPVTKQAIAALPISTQQADALRSQEMLQQQTLEIERLARKLLPTTNNMFKGHFAGAQIAANRYDPKYEAEYSKLVAAVNLAAGNVRTLQRQAGAESERDYTRALTALSGLEASFAKGGDTYENVAGRLTETRSALQAFHEIFARQLRQGAPNKAGGPPEPSELADLPEGKARKAADGFEYARINGHLVKLH